MGWMTAQQWSREKTETLRALHKAGLTPNQMARHLKVTRNAVVGKLYRLGLRGRQRKTKGIV
jgi:GcrA cell cycle regulator